MKDTTVQTQRQQRGRMVWPATAVLLIALMLLTGAARATIFNVNSISDHDDGTCDAGASSLVIAGSAATDCSLREAINAANALAGNDTINIAFTNTITLGSALPDLTGNVTIQGTGPTGVATVDAGGVARHFVVASGTTVTLARLHLMNGSGSNGGAISNSGTLTINNSTLSGNSGGSFGGAIYNSGTVEVIGSTLNGNTSTGYGGAVFNGGSVTLINSTLTDNQATDGGGALADNTGNETFVIKHCTIAGNRSLTAGGGGGFDFLGTTSATLSHTILAGNTANGALLNYGSNGAAPPLTSNGYNLSDDAPAGFSGASNDIVNNANINLGALATNGGPTKTMALLPGSAAINAGDPAFAPPPDFDQRGSGFARVREGRIDIGAYELDPAQSGPTFVVNVTTDNDDGACSNANCSLREAINAANAHAGKDTISIPLAAIITLSSALPDLTGDVTINGTSFSGVTKVDTGGVARHFVVTAGTTVTLVGLRLVNGNGSNGSNGGAIFNSGTLTINRSTISGNTASSGGAISNIGTLTINNSTLSGNTSTGYGGAITNHNKVTLNSCTLTDNEATIGGGALADNGGDETFVIKHCTIAGNRSLTAGSGGGFDFFGTTNASLSHTILAGNTANGVLRNYASNDGTPPSLISAGYNLSDDAPAGLSSVGDQTNNPAINLGILAFNGGPTQTMALLPASAAFNGGDPFFSGPPNTDQRGSGFPRVREGRIDIGAFESDPVQGGPTSIVNVKTDFDDGACTNADCSLREAINAANSTAGNNTISFHATVTGTINLTGVLPDLSSNIKINGHGNLPLTVRRNSGGDYRIFTVTSGSTVEINGLTISNGKDSSFGGGGISNGGTLKVTNCTLTGNSASSFGGGITNGSGPLEVTGSTFANNSANFSGGGIYNNGGTLKVMSSTFAGNSSAFAGGIYNQGGTLKVINSTFTGNSAASYGGGIHNNDGTLEVTNSTFTGNVAADFSGGGIVNDGGLTITNSTFSGNSAGGGGGGIFSAGTLTLHNSIVALNTSSGPPDINGAAAAASSFNLIGIDTGLTGISNGGNGNQIGTAAAPINPKLGGLADNGGPTKTMALRTGSTAINAGDPAFAAPPNTDQRGTGFPRKIGGRIDIGAFEANLLSIDNVTLPEGNPDALRAVANAKAFTFTVKLAAPSSKTVTLKVATGTASGSKATAGSDYIALPSTTVTFAPGETSQPVNVLVKGDVRNEFDEKFAVNLSAATNAAITDVQGIGTIVNDDDPPTISISDRTIIEGNSGTKDMLFTVRLSSASGKVITVNYGTNDGTAKQPADYIAQNGTLTFNPGDPLSQTITIKAQNDLLDEATEAFFVKLSAPVNATIKPTDGSTTDGVGKGTINDNDDPSVLSG